MARRNGRRKACSSDSVNQRRGKPLGGRADLNERHSIARTGISFKLGAFARGPICERRSSHLGSTLVARVPILIRAADVVLVNSGA